MTASETGPTWLDRIEALAREHPDLPAITFTGEGGETLSWRDLAWRTAGIAEMFAARGVLVCLEVRQQRAACAGLQHRHLAHWHYAAGEWQRHCERLRHELWFRTLVPAARYLAPLLVLAIGLSAALEPHADLAPGLLTLVVAIFGIVVASLLLGPALQQFVRLSVRKRLDYEVYVGEPGVLEVWRNGGRVAAMEGHLYVAAGSAIERVEARGAEPSEIVFSVGQPRTWGVDHLEEHFLVPQGRLGEARDIARKLSRRPSPIAFGPGASFGPG